MWHNEEYNRVRTKIVQKVEGIAKLQKMVKKKKNVMLGSIDLPFEKLSNKKEAIDIF